MPRDVTWRLSDECRGDLRDVRAGFGDRYNAQIAALRESLCAFFSGDSACMSKHGTQISPVGGTEDGGKLLKVRWLRPGCGRSGGLRLALVAYSDERLVVLCRSWARSEDPDDADFEAAGKLAGRYR
jgi:hypothetical protein